MKCPECGTEMTLWRTPGWEPDWGDPDIIEYDCPVHGDYDTMMLEKSR